MRPMALPAQRQRQPERAQRYAYADNLKVLMVAAVILGHVCIAWTGIGEWVFEEEPLREPLFSLVALILGVGALLGLALFFVIAGQFTPHSLARKGLHRFLVDRVLRLGVPMVFFVIFLSPFVEYVDSDNVGWDRGFAAFTVDIWLPPAPGPTWFLGVLLLFSVVYAVVRTIAPRAPTRPTEGTLTVRHLLMFAAAITVTSYLVRMEVPLAEERYRLALGQAPAWIAAFTFGVVGGERGWFDSLTPRVTRAAGTMALAALVPWATVLVYVAATGGEMDPFLGGGTWQSLFVAVIEGCYILGLSVWLLAVFRRKHNHQGRLARELSRGAYAAFVIHQIVLVGLVLATHEVSWPPEVDFLVVAVAGVAFSFGTASLLVRLPGVRRIL